MPSSRLSLRNFLYRREVGAICQPLLLDLCPYRCTGTELVGSVPGVPCAQLRALWGRWGLCCHEDLVPEALGWVLLSSRRNDEPFLLLTGLVPSSKSPKRQLAPTL